jgi:hypothetical protein
MNPLVFIGVLLLSSLTFAESTLPPKCKAIAVVGESVTVRAKKNKLIFIHNITNTDLWITETDLSSAKSQLTGRLQTDKWSALGLTKGSLLLNCIESRPGHEQQIPCEGAIAVCLWDKATFPENHEHATFWASEDQSIAGITAALGAKGFVLPVG